MQLPTTRRLSVALVSCLTLSACSGSDAGKPATRASVLTISTVADADALIPPLVSTTSGKQAVDRLYDFLAEAKTPISTSGDGGFGPQLATRWQWAPDSLSIAFSIDPRARWHDGASVRASDVRFSFALFTDPKVASMHASDFVGIDSVSVRDSLTAVVWWHARSPEQFFQIAYNLQSCRSICSAKSRVIRCCGPRLPIIPWARAGIASRSGNVSTISSSKPTRRTIAVPRQRRVSSGLSRPIRPQRA